MVTSKKQTILLGIIIFAGLAAANWILDGLVLAVSTICKYIIQLILAPLIRMLFYGLRSLILFNPDVNAMKPVVFDVINMLAPVYVVVISLLGIYIIFLSESPQGRAKAKNMFWKTILSMCLVSLSLEIFKIILFLSESLANRILAGILTTELAQMSLSLEQTNIFLVILVFLFLCLILILASVVALWRFIVVLILCAIFPIILFLYFFDLTKDVGSNLMRYAIIVIFTQPMQALMLGITVVTLNLMPAGAGIGEILAQVFLIMAGALMIVIAPLMMMGLLKWIGGVIAGAGIIVSMTNPALGAAMTTVGGIATGMGPGALMAGGLTYFYGAGYQKSMEALNEPRGLAERIKDEKVLKDVMKKKLNEKLNTDNLPVGSGAREKEIDKIVSLDGFDNQKFRDQLSHQVRAGNLTVEQAQDLYTEFTGEDGYSIGPEDW